jgi:hypothetical protein
MLGVEDNVMQTAELTLLIAERANQIAQSCPLEPGGELALWLEAEAEVKRERQEKLRSRIQAAGSLIHVKGR